MNWPTYDKILRHLLT